MSKWNKIYFRGTTKTSKIDKTRKVLSDVVVVQTGEASGHGVHLDQEFIENVVQLSKSHKVGVKARFGHPSMSSDALGTEIGRFHNFRVRGNQAIADLHLGTYAEKSPNGDYPTYIMDFAEEDPDAFGTSIVFKAGEPYQIDEKGEKIDIYKRGKDGKKIYDFYGYPEKSDKYDPDKPVYQSINELLGADLVDTPAATNGMFSELYSHAFAAKFSDFLDENQDIDKWLSENPEVEQKIKSFLARRQSYKSKPNMEEKTTEQVSTNDTEKRLSGIEKAFAKLASIVQKDDAGAATSEEETPTDPIAELKAQLEETKKQLAAQKAAEEAFKKKEQEFAKTAEQLKEEIKALGEQTAQPEVKVGKEKDLIKKEQNPAPKTHFDAFHADAWNRMLKSGQVDKEVIPSKFWRDNHDGIKYFAEFQKEALDATDIDSIQDYHMQRREGFITERMIKFNLENYINAANVKDRLLIQGATANGGMQSYQKGHQAKGDVTLTGRYLQVEDVKFDVHFETRLWSTHNYYAYLIRTGNDPKQLPFQAFLLQILYDKMWESVEWKVKWGGRKKAVITGAPNNPQDTVDGLGTILLKDIASGEQPVTISGPFSSANAYDNVVTWLKACLNNSALRMENWALFTSLELKDKIQDSYEDTYGANTHATDIYGNFAFRKFPNVAVVPQDGLSGDGMVLVRRDVLNAGFDGSPFLETRYESRVLYFEVDWKLGFQVAPVAERFVNEWFLPY